MLPRASLTRSSSLESPKKLRFATGTQLENYRYHRLVFYFGYIRNNNCKIFNNEKTMVANANNLLTMFISGIAMMH